MVAVTARPGVDVVRASHPATASASTTPSAADAARRARCRSLPPGAAAGAVAEEFHPARSDLKPPPPDRPLERLAGAPTRGGGPAPLPGPLGAPAVRGAPLSGVPPRPGPPLRGHGAPARSEPPGRAIQVHGL